MAEYYQLLRRHLTGSLPAPQWPANTRLDHYRDDLAPAIHAVLRMTQEQGGGRALLLHCFQVFKQRGEPYVDLKVLESNLRARHLYESAGMVFVLRDVVAED